MDAGRDDEQRQAMPLVAGKPGLKTRLVDLLLQRRKRKYLVGRFLCATKNIERNPGVGCQRQQTDWIGVQKRPGMKIDERPSSLAIGGLAIGHGAADRRSDPCAVGQRL